MMTASEVSKARAALPPQPGAGCSEARRARVTGNCSATSTGWGTPRPTGGATRPAQRVRADRTTRSDGVPVPLTRSGGRWLLSRRLLFC